MLESLLGSKNRERVLLFLYSRSEGYASEIAQFYRTSLTPFQKQLSRLELGGIIVCRLAGRTRLYQLNPRYPFARELRALLGRSAEFMEECERNRLALTRRRPRRKVKPTA